MSYQRKVSEVTNVSERVIMSTGLWKVEMIVLSEGHMKNSVILIELTNVFVF